MKNLCSIIVILLSWSFLVFIYSCKDECKCKTSTSADFKIYEPLEDNYKFNEINNEDTAGIGITFFEAQDSSTDIISYEWRIGSDTRVFSKRSLSLQFQNKLNNLSVQLIVKKSVDKICFPTDDGIDTLVKTFSLVDTSLAYGNFEGYCVSKPDEKFTVSTIFQSKIGYSYISNLPNGCVRDYKDAQEMSYFSNYRYIKFGKPNVIRTGAIEDVKCQIPWGLGKIQPDNKTLILDYQIWNPNKNQFVTDRFIGIKK